MKRALNCSVNANELCGARRVLILLPLLILSLVPVALAQQAASGTGAALPAEVTSSSPALSSESDERYRIGAGDVLDIRVFNRPQLSLEAVRVDGRGMIRMPLIEEDIQAACRTEGELAKDIATRYLKYQRNPQVDVFIKEFNSQPVAVIGAVNQPGRFQLRRRIRLLELLTFAGGPAQRAGRNIQVIHTATPSACEVSAGAGTDEITTGFVTYKLNETLRGSEDANPYLRPGDIVTVPDADQIYVVGNVLKPSAFPLNEPLTVTRAIAMAGGTMPDTKSERVRIVRQLPGSTSKTEIFVDLKAIDRRQADDVVLQANDIVDVPTSGGKRLLRTLLGAVVPAAAQLPVRVIP